MVGWLGAHITSPCAFGSIFHGRHTRSVPQGTYTAYQANLFSSNARHRENTSDFQPQSCSHMAARLLVHPLELRLVVCKSLREPEPNLALGALDCIRSMDDVPADINAEVPADAARLCTARHNSIAAPSLECSGKPVVTLASACMSYCHSSNIMALPMSHNGAKPWKIPKGM